MLFKVDNVDKWGVNGVCKNFVKNYLIFIQIYTNLSFHIYKFFGPKKIALVFLKMRAIFFKANMQRCNPKLCYKLINYKNYFKICNLIFNLEIFGQHLRSWALLDEGMY